MSPALAPERKLAPEHEDIAKLAYAYWEERSMNNLPGSTEEDWYRAEMELGGEGDTLEHVV